MEAIAIMQLIFLVSDLLVIAPLQYAKLKKAIDDGTLTEEQIDTLIAASEQESGDLIAAIDDL